MTKATNIQEVGKDILSTLDFMTLVDTSGSTSKPSARMKGKTRHFEMQEQVGMIARACAQYDDDGITVVQFSTRVKVYDGVTADKVETVFAENEPGGNTNLGDAIREVTKKAKASTKEVVAFCFTDGEASSEDDVVRAIADLAKLGRPKVGLIIVQVGDDPDATAFLQRLDDQLEAKGIPDVVSTVNFEEAESLTFGNQVWLARNS